MTHINWQHTWLQLLLALCIVALWGFFFVLLVCFFTDQYEAKHIYRHLELCSIRYSCQVSITRDYQNLRDCPGLLSARLRSIDIEGSRSGNAIQATHRPTTHSWLLWSGRHVRRGYMSKSLMPEETCASTFTMTGAQTAQSPTVLQMTPESGRPADLHRFGARLHQALYTTRRICAYPNRNP